MKTLQKLSALVGVSLMLFTGCEHPTTIEELPYYYSESIAYLDDGNSRFTVNHSPDGIVNQDLTIPVTVGVTKVLANDCRVVLECTVEGEGFSLQHVVIPGNGVVTIPAGERSATILLSISDWSFCSGVDEARSYTISMKIVEATTRISTNKGSAVYVLDKTSKSYTTTAAPTEGAQVGTDAYTVSYSVVADAWNPLTIDAEGLYPGYLYYANYLGLEFDLGSTKTVTGVANVCAPYGPSYNAAVYTIQGSVDGQTWTTYDEGLSLEQSDPQYVSFYTPVDARYVRLLMYGSTAFSTGALIFAK